VINWSIVSLLSGPESNALREWVREWFDIMSMEF